MVDSLCGVWREARKTKVLRGGWAGRIPTCRDYTDSPDGSLLGFLKGGIGSKTRDLKGQSDDTFPFEKIDTGGIPTAAARAPPAKEGLLDQSETGTGGGPPQISHRTVPDRSNSIRRLSIDSGPGILLSDWLSILHVLANDP